MYNWLLYIQLSFELMIDNLFALLGIERKEEE